MYMIDLLQKKKRGDALQKEEIDFFVDGVRTGAIPDYQISAFLMAICFQGMNYQETAHLTHGMARSGDQVDLSHIPGIKVDKHSTGGVGDKTTLILAPLVAACGVPVAKMSGRGLGYTGGTIDKLESIPGFTTSMDQKTFLDTIKDIGVCVAGQSGNLAPVDKKLYALRDVTATVDSIPLIAASVMSKKIAAGADGIVLDVKCGSGAFMKTPQEAALLAREMVQIGKACGRKMAAIITNMDIPLGKAIGNGLEVAEAIEVLSGKGPDDLREISLLLAAQMLFLGGKGTEGECLSLAKTALDNGQALQKFRAMCKAQGGDTAVLDYPEKLYEKARIFEVLSPSDGFVQQMNAQGCGRASMVLGAGRETKQSIIDPAAGIVLLKKTGDAVKSGDPLARLFTNRPEQVDFAREILLGSYQIGAEKPGTLPVVYDTIVAG